MLKLIFSSFDKIFYVAPETETLKVFRKATALFYFITLLALFPNWNRFYGWSHVSYGAAYPMFDIFSWFSFLPFQTFWVVGFFICVWHWIGKHPASSSFALFLFHSTLIRRNSYATNGEDLVVRMLLLYGCFFPWLKEGLLRGGWAIRMAQINFIAIYALSLPKKLAADAAWFTGDFMYYVLVNPNWSRVTAVEFATAPGVSMLLTYGSILSEAAFVILIWFQRTRLMTCLVLISFHLIIGILLNNVTFFSFSMCLGAILFLKDAEINKLKLSKLTSSV